MPTLPLWKVKYNTSTSVKKEKSTVQRSSLNPRLSPEENADRYRQANRSIKEIAQDKALKKELSKGPLEVFRVCLDILPYNWENDNRGNVYVAAYNKKEAINLFKSISTSRIETYTVTGEKDIKPRFPLMINSKNLAIVKKYPNNVFYAKCSSEYPSNDEQINKSKMISLKDYQKINTEGFDVYTTLSPHDIPENKCYFVSAGTKEGALKLVTEKLKKTPSNLYKTKALYGSKSLYEIIMECKDSPNRIVKSTHLGGGIFEGTKLL